MDEKAETSGASKNGEDEEKREKKDMVEELLEAEGGSKSMVTQNQLLSRHEEVRRRQEYEQEYGNSESALEPLNVGNAANHGADNPEGPPAFTRALRTLQWPRGFKITGVEPYEGRMNPT